MAKVGKLTRVKTTKKAPAKKAGAKKAVAKAGGSGKPAAKKATTKKPPAKKSPARKTPAKKTLKKAPTGKTVKKASVKKAAAKKASVKKAAAKKASVKKASVKKAAAKKASVKKGVERTKDVGRKAPIPKAAAKKKTSTKRGPSKKKRPSSKAAMKKAAPTKGAKRTALDPVGTSERSPEAPFAQPADVRVLVVDDEPEILEMVAPQLRAEGYQVFEAEDGEQALDVILVEKPHVVVLDVMMPKLSGWEVCRYVRTHPEHDDVRIIMATGIGPETNAATSPLYGADAYLDKPFRLDALSRMIRALAI